MHAVLALETSCDESAAAVLRRHADGRIEVLASRIASQIEEHARWGGVVPEIASRRHVEALPSRLLPIRVMQRASACPRGGFHCRVVGFTLTTFLSVA